MTDIGTINIFVSNYIFKFNVQPGKTNGHSWPGYFLLERTRVVVVDGGVVVVDGGGAVVVDGGGAVGDGGDVNK